MKFKVRLARTETRFMDVEIEAESAKEADKQALDKAGDFNFRDGNSSTPIYDVDEIKGMEERKP